MQPAFLLPSLRRRRPREAPPGRHLRLDKWDEHLAFVRLAEPHMMRQESTPISASNERPGAICSRRHMKPYARGDT